MLVVAPGDLTGLHTGDVEYASNLNAMIGRQVKSTLFCFEGHTATESRARFYLSLPKRLFALTRQLLLTEGLVLVYNHHQIVVWSHFVRSIFRRRYYIMIYVPNTTLLVPGRPLIGRMYNSLVWSLGMAFSDAIGHDPSGVPAKLVGYSAIPVLSLPDVIVDTDDFAYSEVARAKIRKSLEIEQDEMVVGMIGPFHGANLPSLKYLKQNLNLFRKDTHFVIIGDCPSNYRFMHSRVGFVGRVERLSDWLSVCDVILIPRLVDYGAPMGKMIHAMAVGLPVVTNNPEGMTVTSGVDAVVGSIDELPTLTSTLLEDPCRAKRIGANARHKIEREYSLKANEEKLVTFIAKYLNSEKDNAV